MEVSGHIHASAALTPKKEHPGTRWIGGWVGSRARLDTVRKRKIPSPRRESNPRTPIFQLEQINWPAGDFAAVQVKGLKEKHGLCLRLHETDVKMRDIEQRESHRKEQFSIIHGLTLRIYMDMTAM